MRAIMIAQAVFFFCLATAIVNGYEAAFYEETGNVLFGFTVEAPITRSDMPYVDEEASFNETAREFMNPQEQPTGLGLQSLISGATFLWKAGTLIFSGLFNSTIGFFWWIQNMGRSDFQFVPYDIAAAITSGVYTLYLVAIWQWYSNRNVRVGG